MMKQEWQPNRKSDIPIYIQIKEYVKEKIAIGEWPIGTRLPSQRKLALLFNEL
ncbi:hypothetical protein [Salipaludibacillus sp. CF4.18]|uniref:hypothetical protein n=1 Tax=Salipaludibacillus sp. CF4.18 TaxID=3373081 RepID=UPI003EE7D426